MSNANAAPCRGLLDAVSSHARATRAALANVSTCVYVGVEKGAAANNNNSNNTGKT